MVSAQPLTITNKLIETIRREIGLPTDYIDPTNNFSYRRCLDECNKLIKVNPYNGLIIKARLLGWSGDVDAMRACYEQALRYDFDESGCANYLHGLMDLGFYSEARVGYAKLADPKRGGFNDFAMLLYMCGGYKAAYTSYQEALRLGIKIDSKFDENIVSHVNFAMDRFNLSDELLSQYLDLAGEIMRSKRVINFTEVLIPAIVLNMDGVLLVYISIQIKKNPEFVAEMNMDLMDLIVERDMPRTEAILAHFIPV